MAISFGSVGDIIAVCLLAKDLVEALDDSRGSAAEYRDIVRELGGLERCLLQVDLLCRFQDQNAEILPICDIARDTVRDCRETLKELSMRVKKYDRYMGSSGSLALVPDALMKIRFRISDKGRIEKYRAKISSHRESLGMVLAIASVHLQKLNGNKMDEMKDTAGSSHRSMVELIGTINGRIGANTSELSEQKSVITKVAESIGWISQTCTYIKTVLGTLLSLSWPIHNAVLALHTKLPSSLELTLIDDPFILEDALGRKTPVHLQFIDSKEYVFQDYRTGRDIMRSRPWEGAFRPGQRVDMSMVFKHVEHQGQPSTTNDTFSTCPGCKLPNPHSTGMDVECMGCGLFYRRVRDVEETEPVLSAASAVPFASGSSVGPEAALEQEHDCLTEQIEELLLSFKRVRIVSRRQERVKQGLDRGIEAPPNESGFMKRWQQQQLDNNPQLHAIDQIMAELGAELGVRGEEIRRRTDEIPALTEGIELREGNTALSEQPGALKQKIRTIKRYLDDAVAS
ncbi:hypothetical protein MFIFM68171_02944 [Madurella fahalii]|uniref:Fungal N-terminal domain-containing protein n=1 Tax=Madurella fahalii TaxID=1157608 RepID=A0ABQ0G4Z9_9PEZI